MTIIVAFGTSTPASMTVTATITSSVVLEGAQGAADAVWRGVAVCWTGPARGQHEPPARAAGRR
ncbi:hypothetical protein [Actinorhabdospora filicis]|uniref:hypothetical protein n=1 Tax=Actinorhabdospora filicis TaxID=1785913 RepID=UPI003D7F5642